MSIDILRRFLFAAAADIICEMRHYAAAITMMLADDAAAAAID